MRGRLLKRRVARYPAIGDLRRSASPNAHALMLTYAVGLREASGCHRTSRRQHHLHAVRYMTTRCVSYPLLRGTRNNDLVESATFVSCVLHLARLYSTTVAAAARQAHRRDLQGRNSYDDYHPDRHWRLFHFQRRAPDRTAAICCTHER